MTKTIFCYSSIIKVIWYVLSFFFFNGNYIKVFNLILLQLIYTDVHFFFFLMKMLFKYSYLCTKRTDGIYAFEV